MSEQKTAKNGRSKLKAFLNAVYETAPLTLTALFFCVSIHLIGYFESYTFCSNEASRAQEPSTALHLDDEQEANADVPFITDTRRVAEYENILGIYNCFGELIGTFSADLSVLPMSDRKLLKEGIVFDSEGEMRDFLESLDS